MVRAWNAAENAEIWPSRDAASMVRRREAAVEASTPLVASSERMASERERLRWAMSLWSEATWWRKDETSLPVPEGKRCLSASKPRMPNREPSRKAWRFVLVGAGERRTS